MSNPKAIESATIVLQMSDGTTQTIEFHKGGEIKAAMENETDRLSDRLDLPSAYRIGHPTHVTEQRYRFELTIVARRYADYSASDGNIFTITDPAIAAEASS